MLIQEGVPFNFRNKVQLLYYIICDNCNTFNIFFLAHYYLFVLLKLHMQLFKQTFFEVAFDKLFKKKIQNMKDKKKVQKILLLFCFC